MQSLPNVCDSGRTCFTTGNYTDVGKKQRNIFPTKLFQETDIYSVNDIVSLPKPEQMFCLINITIIFVSGSHCTITIHKCLKTYTKGS